MINKTIIYEAAIKLIDEGIEWGFDSEHGEYAHYVDGVCSLTYDLIKKIESIEKITIPDAIDINC